MKWVIYQSASSLWSKWKEKHRNGYQGCNYWCGKKLSQNKGDDCNLFISFIWKSRISAPPKQLCLSWKVRSVLETMHTVLWVCPPATEKNRKAMVYVQSRLVNIKIYWVLAYLNLSQAYTTKWLRDTIPTYQKNLHNQIFLNADKERRYLHKTAIKGISKSCNIQFFLAPS